MLLSKTLVYINSALNYPALTYPDISLFFDMAIAELNTTLHTSLPSVSVMIDEFKQKMSKPESDKIILTSNPATSSTPYNIPVTSDPSSLTEGTQCYYDSTDGKFHILNSLSQEYTVTDKAKAIYIDSSGNYHQYQAIIYGGIASWSEIPTDPLFECNLLDYLPDDWVLLWLIPYVCFKYTARDGGTAQTFAQELTEGYQQLQETYDVPDKVTLATYADKYAYRELVEANFSNLNIKVPTRAIYESMKHSRNINAIFGSFYDRGGF